MDVPDHHGCQQGGETGTTLSNMARGKNSTLTSKHREI